MFDSLTEALQQVEQELRKLEPTEMIGTQPARVIERLVAHERRVAGARLRCTARASEMEFWQRLGFKTFEEWLAATHGTTHGQARRKAATAKNLTDHDDVADALADGEISEDEADVVSDAASKNPEAEKELLDTAKNKSKSHTDLKKKAAKAKASGESDRARAERLRKGRRAGWGPDDDGFWGLWGKLQPQIGAKVKKRLERETNRLFETARKNGDRNPQDWYRADALAAAILGYDPDTTTDTARRPEPATSTGSESSGSADASATAGGPATDHQGPVDDRTGPASAGELRLPGLDDERNTATPPAAASTTLDAPVGGARNPNVEMVIVIDLAPLRRGCVYPGETCEIRGIGPIPVEVARQWMDDAFIKAVIKDGSDIKAISHFGRHVNARIRTGLDLLDPVCAVPNCDNERLEYDHEQPHGGPDPGPTSLDNLRPPCKYHHDQITYKGYKLEGEPGDRCWIDPEGTVLFADDPRKVDNLVRGP